MPNLSSLAGLEVAEKFVRGWGGVGGVHVTIVSNSKVSYIRVALSRVEFRWVLTIDWDSAWKQGFYHLGSERCNTIRRLRWSFLYSDQ